MKARYFKTTVPMYIRLDSEASDPYGTLNGALQFMEDQTGIIFADTQNIECEQITKTEAVEVWK